MIGVAMLSFWHLHAYDYVKDVDANPATRLVAIWDEDPMRGQAEADARGVPFYADLDACLADPAVAAVVVDSPTSMHEEVIVRSARAGKHVFTEKVLAATSDEAVRIADAVKASGVTMIVSMRRSDDASTHDIAALLQAGTVGRVTFVRVRDSHPFALPSEQHPDGWLPQHFWDTATAQGGAVIDLCHPLYLVATLLGLPERVSATLTAVTGHAVEDNAVLTMTYPDGAVAVAETSYVSAIAPFSIEVHGTEGSIVYAEPGIGEIVDGIYRGADDDQTHRPVGRLLIRRNTPDASRSWESVELSTGHPTAFQRWIDLIEAGEGSADNTTLALRLTAIVEAAYESHRQQRPVDVRPVP